jgi:peptidylprolyl isomerase
MNNQQTSWLATAGGRGVNVAECLRSLQRHGRLKQVALQALADKTIAEAAREAGLAVTTEELQQAADRWRKRHALTQAARTQQWLTTQGWIAADFEAFLQHDLLTIKLRDHLSNGQVATHFETHRDGYAQARLRLIAVGQESLARELLTQVREDGRDFAELARQHSQHPTAGQGGLLGVVSRRQLPPAVVDVVFAAHPGTVVGPVALPEGFHLFLVEGHMPAALDDATTERIRQELFDRWLADTLKDVSFTLPDDL